MRSLLTCSVLDAVLAISASTIVAQDLSFNEMRWRDIGPTRADDIAAAKVSAHVGAILPRLAATLGVRS